MKIIQLLASRVTRRLSARSVTELTATTCRPCACMRKTCGLSTRCSADETMTASVMLESRTSALILVPGSDQRTRYIRRSLSLLLVFLPFLNSLGLPHFPDSLWRANVFETLWRSNDDIPAISVSHCLSACLEVWPCTRGMQTPTVSSAAFRQSETRLSDNDEKNATRQHTYASVPHSIFITIALELDERCAQVVRYARKQRCDHHFQFQIWKPLSLRGTIWSQSAPPNVCSYGDVWYVNNTTLTMHMA